MSPGTATEVTTTSKGAEEGGSGGRARQVLERAVSAAPFCLEIWEALVRDVMAGIGGEGSGVTVEDARRCGYFAGRGRGGGVFLVLL